MSTLFLSHSSQDSTFVDKLRRQLVEQGHRSLFLDYDPDFGIPAGREWEKEIYQQLRSCQGVIVVCSLASMQSMWVFAEVTHARALGKKIFPLRIDHCTIHAILKQHQVVDMRNEAADGFRRLFRGLNHSGLDPVGQLDWDGSRSPYPGLVSFDEADAAVFFGRRSEIQQGVDLLNRVRQFNGSGMVTVLGASGCGKSSLVRAGLIPRLRQDPGTWLPLTPVRPSRNAFRQAAIALSQSFATSSISRSWREIERLLRTAARTARYDDVLEILEDLRIDSGRLEATIVLVVDQAEELLTDTQPPSHPAESDSVLFLELVRALLEAQDARLMILCTLRSDYLGLFQQHPVLQGVAFDDLPVGPITRAGLVDVIEGPAERGGLLLEHGLTETIIDDLRNTNALPLLSFSLRQLYEGRDAAGQLTLGVYRDRLGGLAGSVRTVAEAVFRSANLSADQMLDLREAFLAMVRINDEDRPASRPVRWVEASVSVRPVLEHFVKARLLIARDEAGERTVEVAHEALFSVWDRLNTWLDEDRERLRLRERLRQAAADWVAQDRNPGLLIHRGTRLNETEELSDMSRFRLTDGERCYLAACIAERDSAREADRRRADLARVAVATDWLSRDVGNAALVLAEVRDPDATPFAVARMNEVIARGFQIVERRTHDSQALAVFSPDGQFFATAAPDRMAKIWRADGSGAPVILPHQGQLNTITYSPDGRLIATSGNDGLVTVWPVDGSRAPVELASHGESLAFSPDSEQLVATASDGSARMWRADGTGEPIHFDPFDHPDSTPSDAAGWITRPAWMYHSEPRTGMGGGESEYFAPPAWYRFRTRPGPFRPDGQALVTSSIHGVSLFWRADGSGDPTVLLHRDSVLSATFSPDGQYIVTASYDGDVYFSDGDGVGPDRTLPHDTPVLVAVFSPDGSRLATSSADGIVRIWSMDELWSTSKPDGWEPSGPVMLRHDEAAYGVEFSPDGELVLTVDGTARIWRSDGRGTPLILPGHASGAVASFSPDGERVLTDHGGVTRIWSVRPVVFDHGTPVLSATFSPTAEHILTVGDDNAVRIWPLNRLSRSLSAQHAGRVRALVFSPDGTQVLTASDDGTARIQALDGSREPIVLNHGASVSVAAFSPDSTHVVTGAEDGLTRVWSARELSDPVVLGPPGSYKGRTEVNAVAFSPDGTRVLSASGALVRIWTPTGSSGPLVLMGRHYGGYIESVTRAWFTPDGHGIVAIGSAVRLWRSDGKGDPLEYRDGGSTDSFAVSADGRRFVQASAAYGVASVFSIEHIAEPAVFRGWEGAEPLFGPDAASVEANRMQISADGSKIAIVSRGNVVRVWSADGAGGTSILKHEAAVNSVTFSPDGGRVATVSEDGSARVWRADGTGEPLMLWHRSAVNTVSFSPDGETIVTASDDGAARRWWLNGNRLWLSVRQLTSRCLTPDFRERYLDESADEAERAYRECERSRQRTLGT